MGPKVAEIDWGVPSRVEMGLPIESPIFPTLTFKRLPNHQVELLYYRIGEEFKDAIYQATEK
jgi:hypothetical protein